MTSTQLFLVRGNPIGDRYPHWMLMVANVPNTGLTANTNPRGTRFHSEGGPFLRRAYTVGVQPNRRLRSQATQNPEHLSSIHATDAQIERIARTITPQQCQKYIVSLLAEMERQGLIVRGHAQRLAGQVQMSPEALEYESQHPVPPPAGINLPPSWPGLRATSPPRSQRRPAGQQPRERREKSRCCLVM